MYVELKNINKHFGNFKASDNVSFGIEKGKLIGLLGSKRFWQDDDSPHDCRP